MKITTDPEGMNLEQRKKAAAIGLIHNAKHWSVKKKVYPTPYGSLRLDVIKLLLLNWSVKYVS